MGRREQRLWEGKGRESGLSRRNRQSCRYDVYIPDYLAGQEFTFDSSAAADISDAERAARDLDAKTSTLADTEALARLLLRTESVASSKIEGLVVGARRLLRADAARASGEDGADVTAAEVLGNIEAMTYALETVQAGSPITFRCFLKRTGGFSRAPCWAKITAAVSVIDKTGSAEILIIPALPYLYRRHQSTLKICL